MADQRPRAQFLLALAAALLAATLPARASLSVFVGEPFGSFGTMMPLGHTAIYLDHVCADGPLHVRPCQPGESGVVLARYHAIGQYDWLASPVTEFLFALPPATGRAASIDSPTAHAQPIPTLPTFATPDIVWHLREQYRQRYLRAIVPDGQQGVEVGDGRSMGAGELEEWWESAGMAYNRRVWAYQVATTPEQDARLIAFLNASENHHLYHLQKTNCADFAAQLVNVAFPIPDASIPKNRAHLAAHNDRIADFGLMTPKQVARSLFDYAAAHPELHPRLFEIPQIPGSLPRSRRVRGGAESGLKTKRYLLPLLILQPEVPAYLAIIYVWHGRWVAGAGATPLPLGNLPPPDESLPFPPSVATTTAPGTPATVTETSTSITPREYPPITVSTLCWLPPISLHEGRHLLRLHSVATASLLS